MEIDPEIVRGLFALGVAAIGAGWWNKRAVRNAVAEHGNHEMIALDAIRLQLEMMRETQEATNELNIQQYKVADRRLRLIEQRLEHLERV